MPARRQLEGVRIRRLERVFGATPEARLALVRAVWPQVVGRGLASRTEVSSLTNDLLRVRVADRRWMRVLSRMRHWILGRLRGAVGDLAPRQLGFLEGLAIQAEEPAAQPERPRGTPDPAAPPDVAQAAEAIPDPTLRATFLAVAGRYFERTRHGL